MPGGNDRYEYRERPVRASAYRQPPNLTTKLPGSPPPWRRLVGWLLLAAVLVGGGTFTYVLWTLRDMPDPGQQPVMAGTVVVYDRNGQVIDQINAQGRYYKELSLKDMGKWGPIATMAAEDRTFYQHGPLDYTSLARSAAHDVLHASADQGGSTITQQLVKISVLTPQKSIFRKMQEALLATAMERRYSKDQILQMYLNRVGYGHNAYGLGGASTIFFGKNAADLDPAQAAFLAALINGPYLYDPAVRYDLAKQRQLYVLDGMVKMGALTSQEANQAAQENIKPELKFVQVFGSTIAPHFESYVLHQLESLVGPSRAQQGGFKITTTLDLGLQRQANAAVQQGVAKLKGDGVNNGMLLAANPQTGEILAWVGSADYGNQQIGGQFDLVHDGHRQPGSSFKPYVYEAALRDRKITLGSGIQDDPYSYPDGSPLHDWDNRYEGTITARQALLRSRNIPAVEIGQKEGMQNVVNLAHQMGVSSDLRALPSTAIGASEITMMDNVQGYQVFANQGTKEPLMAISKITDASGNTIVDQSPGKQQGITQVLNPAESYLITDTLKEYQNYWNLGWNRQMAGKSGTTNDSSNAHPDAWMMAYDPKIVVGTWAGNTSPTGGKSITAFGTNVGSTMTRQFINSLPSSYTAWFQQPSGLVHGNGCGGGELYLAGTQGDANCSTPPPTPKPTPVPQQATPTPTPIPTPSVVRPTPTLPLPTIPPRSTPTPTP